MSDRRRIPDVARPVIASSTPGRVRLGSHPRSADALAALV